MGNAECGIGNEKEIGKSIGLKEKPNPLSRRIDSASSLEIVGIVNREDEKVVRGRRKAIAKAIKWGAESLFLQ